MDHYKVLGLSMSASAAAIRTAYRRLAGDTRSVLELKALVL